MSSSITSKNITLLGEDFCLQIEHGTDTDMVTVTLNDFVRNEDKSIPGHEHFEANDKVEVYLTPKEVEEVILAFQQVLVKEDNQ
ncbi:hypothetical protein M3598_08205 [Cytobacillus oceanisediminis]|uniref:hypothetical protein n=1 Tax=Cytobacillus oceanisediminis TaxID=665099 RepID=UPI00203FB838|nr:hypothetical protein [Cytobacillus oceanisediminis]MCM3242726.1 hypothetical protein [Cytobacillus oceanisediminis]